MKPKPKIFTFEDEQYGNFRYVIEVRVPWFVGRDITFAMGYKNLQNPIVNRVREEDRKRATFTINGQSPWLINENGLIDLLDAKSNGDTDIRKLGYWFSETVLPQVHQICEEQPDEPADLPDDDTDGNSDCASADDGQNDGAVGAVRAVGQSADGNSDRADGQELTVYVFTDEDFGEIRYVLIDGEPWFIAADVCRILELGNTSQAVSRLDRDEKMTVTVPARGIYSTDTRGGNQTMLAVNEPGLYRLIFASRIPKAKKFQRKVYHEILPSIRKKGYYAVNDTVINTDLVKLHDDIQQMYDLLYKISENGVPIDVDELEQVLEDMIEAFDRIQHIDDSKRISLDKFERGKILAKLAFASKNPKTQEKIIVKAANLIAGEDFV